MGFFGDCHHFASSRGVMPALGSARAGRFFTDTVHSKTTTKPVGKGTTYFAVNSAKFHLSELSKIRSHRELKYGIQEMEAFQSLIK